MGLLASAHQVTSQPCHFYPTVAQVAGMQWRACHNKCRVDRMQRCIFQCIAFSLCGSHLPSSIATACLWLVVYLPVSLHVGCIDGSLLPDVVVRKEQPADPHQQRHSCAVQTTLHLPPPKFNAYPRRQDSAEAAAMRALAGSGSGYHPAPPASRLAILLESLWKQAMSRHVTCTQAVPDKHGTLRLRIRAALSEICRCVCV
jgi:hypothetical protein